MKWKLGLDKVLLGFRDLRDLHFWGIIWAFPKIRGTLLGAPIIRTRVFGGLYWGPLREATKYGFELQRPIIVDLWASGRVYMIIEGIRIFRASGSGRLLSVHGFARAGLGGGFWIEASIVFSLVLDMAGVKWTHSITLVKDIVCFSALNTLF